ncbi:MAG: hypothetical protein CMN25_14045 [Salinicola sp.]|uniref:hypothetical protein n=1 Tax=uncultured Salinicola sp. TaxID=1193542 RepID=UPI000C9536A2|nr:hypothetical protein [uncultured Salinicola sp.]MAM58450.1 hypothetical protein [Salinicola sp.]|tara:strand:+ start:49 stop:888 length:840 start_codon:yes stop_codon:yes gene_type:complete
MPLTQVVNYFNQHLDIFNPRSTLSHHAHFHYRDGSISATLLDRQLYPRQRTVYSLKRLDHEAQEAYTEIRDDSGGQLITDSLYFLAWDREDVVFVDRFQRVLHALHHLSQDPEAKQRLIVDVHWRHIQAVEDSHGSVYEGLLARLGMSPDRVILRLQGEALLQHAHARRAAASFHHRGYPLLAADVATDTPEREWRTLHEHGVRWVSPAPQALASARQGSLSLPRLDEWTRHAKRGGLEVWWPGLDEPGDLGRVSRFEPDFVSGEWIERVVTEAPAVGS